MGRKLFPTVIILLSVWVNALPVFGQNQTRTSGRNLDVKLTPASDRSDVFARMLKGDGIFDNLLTKMNRGDADPAQALRAQNVYFDERFREASKDQFDKTVEKAKEAARKRYEELKSKPASSGVQTTPPGRRRSNHVLSSAGITRKLATSSDGPQITTVEREDGNDVSGTETKTIETAEGTITRTAEAKSTVNFDGKRMSTFLSNTETSEITSKTSKTKLTKTTKMETGAAFDVCPDAKGIVRGTGRMRIFNQTTINTGRDLGALTGDSVVEFKITGYVDDAAQMTHFDMEGTATENLLGYDRALDHELVEDTNGAKDGKGTFVFEVKNSTPPSTSPKDEYGRTKSIAPVLGPSKVQTFDNLSEGQVSRLSEVLALSVQSVLLDVDPLMRSAMIRWRQYECVDVECTAPKTALKPNESVDVTAVTVSKQDLSKVNAKLNGSGDATVTPEDQQGSPSATYTLTAPNDKEAAIYVESVSRRGIGLGSLKLPVTKPKRPPVKSPAPPKKRADAIWSGTISVVHTENSEREGQPSGRLLSERWTKKKRWEVNLTVPGTRDLSGGIINNFHAQTEVTYVGSDFNERRYASGKMGCGKNGPIIMSAETQKFEIIEKGSGRQLLLVGISIIGTHGYLEFGAPESQAERTVIRKYETSCASYDAVNSSTNREPRGVLIGSPSFSVQFVVDPGNPDQISGTKTVVNVDGSEDVFSWSLTRGKE
jgi:hypothetical protein